MATVETELKTRSSLTRKVSVPFHGRHRRFLFVGATSVVAVIVVAALLPTKVPITKLATTAVRDEAVGTGFVRAKVTIGVGAKINGVIVKTHVDQGDVVKKGQILAQLQNQDYRHQVGQALAQVEAQQIGLSSSQATLAASTARLQASLSAVGKVKAGRRLAEISFQRAQSLHEDGVVSRESLDAAETAYLQAQEEVNNAEAIRDAAEREVRAAQADVRAAEKTVSSSQAVLGYQQANLQYTMITSPVDGYVVSRDLEEGATVVPGLPIFTIADSAVIWVAASIDEREVDGLKPGQPATITLRSAPQRKISGSVARIAKQADPVTEELEVDVAFQQVPPDFKLNETAEVYILKQEKPNTKILPQTSIVSGPEGDSVWTVKDGRLHRQPVTVGVADKRGLIEITGGLSDSDMVLVQPSSAGVPLVADQRVRTRWVLTSDATRRPGG